MNSNPLPASRPTTPERATHPGSAACWAFLAAVCAANAEAQQSAPGVASNGDATDTSTATLEEVTVTARYVREASQTVPISISALSGSEIANRGYTSLVDAAAALPNVMLTPMGQASGNAIGAQIRGVGQTDVALTLQPGVGVYIDDVYQGTLLGTEYGLLDIGSVDVLRGPQGTLAGRNSEGGAIQIYSVQPKGENTGYAELGYGNLNHQLLRGAYDFSLLPNRVFLRVTAGVDKHDGYTTRYDYGCSHPGSIVPAQTVDPSCVLGHEGGDNSRMARAILKAIVSDSLEVTLVGHAFEDNAEPAPGKTLALVQGLSGGPTFAGLLALNHPGLNYGNSFLTSNPYSNYETFGDPVPGDSYSGRNYPAENNTNVWGGSATVDWTLPQNLHLKSISAFQDFTDVFTVASVAPFGSVNYEAYNHHQFTEELRLTGTALADSLDWTLGGYYFTGFSRIHGENLLTGLGNDFYQDEPATDANRSGFAHLNYRPIEALGFELGGRYSQDSESYTFNRHFVVPFAIFPAGAPVVTSKRYNTSSSRGDYRFAINYRFTPNVMAYASTSTGYKAGGINPRTTSDATVTTFSPETLTAYEAGLKTEWLDHRLRVNADVFFSNYQNLQLNTTQAVPGGFQVVYENVSHAHIYGVETEVTAQPTRALSFYANAGWLHFKYLDLGGAGFDPIYNTGGITPGAPPPLTPTWKGAIGGSYRISLGNERGSVTLRADESYQSRIYFDNQGTPAASQGGYAVLNTALNWQSQNEAWLVSLRVNNALDKLYWVSESNLINPLGILSAQPSMPRTYMITARHTF